MELIVLLYLLIGVVYTAFQIILFSMFRLLTFTFVDFLADFLSILTCIAFWPFLIIYYGNNKD